MSSLGPPQDNCGFVGDSDTYGLGVRLGAYLQWLTSIFASQFSAQEADTMRGVNTCFTVAMLVALIWRTCAERSHTYPSEAYVLILFCIGGMCSNVLFSRNTSKSESPLAHLTTSPSPLLSFCLNFITSSVGGVIRVALSLAISIYTVWFSFIGLDENKVELPRCSSRVFFFATVNIYGWLRDVLKVLSIGGTILFGTLFFLSLINLGWNSHLWLKNWMEADSSSTEEDVLDQQVTNMTLSYRSIGIALGIFAVFCLAIELTLLWSHVYDVYSCSSTGQLFPLVIGISGLLRLGFVIGAKFFKGDIRIHHSPVV